MDEKNVSLTKPTCIFIVALLLNPTQFYPFEESFIEG